MIARLVFACLLIVFVYFAIKWLFDQPRSTQLKLVIAALIVGLLALIFTGKLHWLFALLGVAIAAIRRLLPLFGLLPALREAFGGQPDDPASNTGQRSDVETKFLKMVLDHDSGEMDGEILGGPHAGMQLSDLSLQELTELLSHYETEDENSARLLRVYLDRSFGPHWGSGARTHDHENDESPDSEWTGRESSAFENNMSKREAYQILGLSADATASEIKLAHRRLMQKFHPDRDGSTFLAAKINQAKDLLLQNLED